MKVFSFDSDRKRQSVLVSDGKNYKLLIKGADSSVLPLLSKRRNHPYLIETQMYLKQFSMLGFRTLVFGERYITEEEFREVERKYLEAIQSVDRQKKLSEIAISLEEDLTLLGCTAIEDSLQDGVVDMVRKCL